jgi:hypothetical protein
MEPRDGYLIAEVLTISIPTPTFFTQSSQLRDWHKMMNMMSLSHILFGVILHLAFIVKGANIGPDGVCALSTFVPFTSGG